MQISAGSARELEYHLLLAKDLGFLVTPNYEELDKRVLEVQRMLASLARRLGRSPGKKARSEPAIANC